jgi:hypothetical protein
MIFLPQILNLKVMNKKKVKSLKKVKFETLTSLHLSKIKGGNVNIPPDDADGALQHP